MSETPKSSDERDSLEGARPAIADESSLARAMEQAFDYRGDVTIETTDGRCIEGYIYNRIAHAPAASVRVMLKAGGDVQVRYDEVRRLTFSGKDTAAGKSWENWVQRYVEKRTVGTRNEERGTRNEEPGTRNEERGTRNEAGTQVHL